MRGIPKLAAASALILLLATQVTAQESAIFKHRGNWPTEMETVIDFEFADGRLYILNGLMFQVFKAAPNPSDWELLGELELPSPIPDDQGFPHDGHLGQRAYIMDWYLYGESGRRWHMVDVSDPGNL